MQITQLQEMIRRVLGDGDFSVTLYACVRDEEERCIKRLSISDLLEIRLRRLLSNAVNRQYLNEDAELEPAQNISDKRIVLYEILQDDLFRPFDFLSFAEKAGKYTEADRAQLLGFAISVEKNDDRLWFYQQSYAFAQIRGDRSILAVLNGNVYTLLEQEIFKFEERIDIAVIGDSIITSKIGLLQKYFGFSDYIRREAEKTMDIIRRIGVLQDSKKLEALLWKDNLTYAKKLMKVKDSPVLTMSCEALVAKLKRLPRYKNVIHFDENGHVLLHSQKDAKEFVKMLNDDIVRSELSDREYDSPSKQLLAPLG